MHVLASLTRAGLCCPLHLERGEHFSLCAIWVGNMDEVFAVFPGAVCMVSSKSTGPTVLQWQDHVCDAFALSSFGTFLPRFLVFYCKSSACQKCVKKYFVVGCVVRKRRDDS